MKYRFLTHVGLTRKNNEDSFLINEKLSLFAVADGMGGHQAGEIASKTAVQTIDQCLSDNLAAVNLNDALNTNLKDLLKEALISANSKVYSQAKDQECLKGMGTTITACLVIKKQLFLAHAGDSRAYLFRDNNLHQLTKDHSLVGEMLRNGGITEEEAFKHPRRNIITRALGIDNNLEIDLYVEKTRPGDLLLLCTDGLSSQVSNEDIKDILQSNSGLDQTINLLMQEALNRGGNDNITIILIEIE